MQALIACKEALMGLVALKRMQAGWIDIATSSREMLDAYTNEV